MEGKSDSSYIRSAISELKLGGGGRGVVRLGSVVTLRTLGGGLSAEEWLGLMRGD